MGLKLFREQHYVSRQVEDSVRSNEMKTGNPGVTNPGYNEIKKLET